MSSPRSSFIITLGHNLPPWPATMTRGLAKGGLGGLSSSVIGLSPLPLSPRKMTLYAGVYGEPPFWVLVSPPPQPPSFRKVAIRGITGIFFRGGKVNFPIFFPGVKCFFLVENYHFGRPKTDFSGFERWKAKKKKGPLFILYFVTFPPSSFNFPPSLFQFSFFSSPFSLFSLPLFSW